MKNIGVFYCCFLPKRRRRRRRKNQGNNETPTLVLGTRQTKGQTFPGNPPKQNKVNKCCQTQRKTKEINACKKFVFHWKHFLPTTQPSTKSCLRDTACMMVTPQIFCCVAVDELMPLFLSLPGTSSASLPPIFNVRTRFHRRPFLPIDFECPYKGKGGDY